ncbi:hypothetical protein L228DRAFT_237308 [Xylona heveae TC161]|uniref:ABM domain-containing protein n=1 Tax=Xylona heveae (strain CBS 132557 / TC161) TaxID=1328760 RepID=A0A165I4H0_XYLHT|nr:hypothetical protein L228DRAFT_237308 [Xylona heveae TC161]KZF24369.1 hypothetical protein L228DRAFT_237308 [Xylona heveae TC161]
MSETTEIAFVSFQPGVSVEDVSSPAGRIWQDMFNNTLDIQGSRSAYWGRVVENPSAAILLVNWDSLSSHTSFQNTPEYAPQIRAVTSLLSSSPLLYHITLDQKALSRALSKTNSFVTEIATWYFPPTITETQQSEFEKHVADLCVEAAKIDGFVPGGTASGWGLEEIKNPKTPEGEEAQDVKSYTLFCAWENVDAHMRFRDTEGFKRTIAPLREKSAAVEMRHVAFGEALRQGAEGRPLGS